MYCIALHSLSLSLSLCVSLHHRPRTRSVTCRFAHTHTAPFSFGAICLTIFPHAQRILPSPYFRIRSSIMIFISLLLNIIIILQLPHRITGSILSNAPLLHLLVSHDLFKIQQHREKDFFKIQQHREDLFKIQQHREDLFKIQQERKRGLLQNPATQRGVTQNPARRIMETR